MENVKIDIKPVGEKHLLPLSSYILFIMENWCNQTETMSIGFYEKLCIMFVYPCPSACVGSAGICVCIQSQICGSKLRDKTKHYLSAHV